MCIWHLCVGASDSDSFSGMGLDLNLVETTGMTLVPGANVRNAVLIRKKGNGYDGDLTLRKWSVQYNFTTVANDGNGQALRTLVDLGAIEMYGRLLKLPYWTCLGVTDQDAAVRDEVDDWWEELAGDEHDRRRLLAYLQIQMKAQGVYDGEINGNVNPALVRAVRAYRVALGQPDDVNLDVNFLRKYLAADHAEVRKVAAARLADIAQKEGPLPPEPVAQAAPQGVPGAANGVPAGQGGPAAQSTATAQSAPAAVPQGGPVAANTATAASAPAAQGAVAAQNTTLASSAAATQGGSPVAARAANPTPIASTTSVAAVPAVAPAPASTFASAAARTSVRESTAAAQPAAYHPAPPIATIPIEGSRPANNAAYRAGEPFFVGVISPRDGYLYCYVLDNQKQVSQFYPASPVRRTWAGNRWNREASLAWKL